MNDASPRWIRTAGESDEAYSAFLAYRDLGADRSLDAVVQELHKSRTILGRWSSRHDWVARSTAWDNHLQAERDKVAVREARKWEQRRQAALEDNWQLAQSLRAKLDRMLAFPLQQTRTSADGKTIIIEPVRWSFQTVALLAKTAAEISAAVLLAVGQDVDEFTDAQARALVDDPAEGKT